MSRPTIIVRVAFQDIPTLAYWTLNDGIYSRLSITTILSGALTPAPVWTDISQYVDGSKSITIKQGRDYELAQTVAGTLTLTLLNKDGRFTPLNSNSPYYPYVKPRRRINVQAVWNGVVYDLFTGFVETWPVDDQNFDSRVTITCSDAFLPFSLSQLNGTFPSEYSNWAINTGLNAIGWPLNDRDLSPNGASLIPSVTLSNTSALQHFLDITSAEQGFFYVNASGKAVFRDRHWRLLNSATSVATFGDATTSYIPYEDVGLVFDDRLIYNDIQVTAISGTTQIVDDTTSQTEYFVQTLALNNVLITSDAEALSKANSLISQYAQPQIRLKSLTLNGDLNPSSVWPYALGTDLGTRITVQRTFPGNSTLTQDMYVEAVEHRITLDTWQVNWQLSPAASHGGWQLGDSVNSLLGVSTYLVY